LYAGELGKAGLSDRMRVRLGVSPSGQDRFDAYKLGDRATSAFLMIRPIATIVHISADAPQSASG
jgi:hypothetical protein